MGTMNRINRVILGVTALALAGSISSAFAFDPLRAKVYGYSTPGQGESELSYSLGYVIDSDKTMNYFSKADISREKLVSHTLEWEYGVTDRWTISLYGDFEKPKSEDLKFTQTRAVVARYRFFNAGERFFNPAVYFEYYVPREQYQGAQEEKLEARIILEKEVNGWEIKVNPILEKPLSDLAEGLVLEYAAGVYKGVSPNLSLGLEAFGEIGQIANTSSMDDQTHYIAPAVEYKVKDGVAIGGSIALGQTKSSEDRVGKFFLEVEL